MAQVYLYRILEVELQALSHVRWTGTSFLLESKWHLQNVFPLAPSLSLNAMNGDIYLLELAAVYLYLKEMKIIIFERDFCRGLGWQFESIIGEYFVLQANLRPVQFFSFTFLDHFWAFSLKFSAG